jgi:hypothetical protein
VRCAIERKTVGSDRASNLVMLVEGVYERRVGLLVWKKRSCFK